MCRYITSPLFTFQIGPDKKEITVHSAPLARLSPTLDTLMNGRMNEAKSRHAHWSDVDEDTFIRLCEFAYNRDYTPPSCVEFTQDPPILQDTDMTIRKKSASITRRKKWMMNYDDVPPAPDWDEPEPVPEPEPEPEPVAEGEVPVEDCQLPYTEKSIWTRHLHDAFKESILHPFPADESPTDTFRPRGNVSPKEDFTPVLLGHARLYVLADKYGIKLLQSLALNKLYHTLKSFKLYERSVGGIIEFVRFTYANTLGDVYGIDDLRDLTRRYMVSVIGQLGGNKEFKELLGDGGDFVVDFWDVVWRDNGYSAHRKVNGGRTLNGYTLLK
ncbi:hypothetical protein AWENTII_009038 [Aspergillus wentii]